MDTRAIATDADEVKLQLERVLRSRPFEKAQRSQRFLRYIVEAALNNGQGAVKEYTIALNVFDRDARYDPSIDATVRVEASRLRGRLREYYADEGKRDRLIIEVPKGGYAAVFNGRGFPMAAELGAGPEAAPEIAQITNRYGILRWLITAIALAAVMMVTIALWLKRPAPIVSVARVSPVTSYPGDEREPSLSPDGRQVAFSWDGEDGHRHIYVKLLGEQHAVRLTYNQADDTFPAWSTDSKHIAFIRRTAGAEGEIILISSIGGPERSLHPINVGYALEGAGRLMAWTPDGKWLCFTSKAAPAHHHKLFLISIDSGSVRSILGKSAGDDADDAAPAFSPDGRWLVFARFSSGPFNSKLLFQQITDDLQTVGPPLVVGNTTGNATTPVWLPDSKRVLFLDNGDRVMQAEIGHPARLVYAAGTKLGGLTAGGSGHGLVELVASSHIEDTDIWTLPLKGLTQGGRVTCLVQSTAMKLQPRFSPDGRTLAFGSNQSGESEIWLADANGENPRQLTHLNAFITGFPWWSPDGNFLAFHARLPDEAQIYTIRVRDGLTRQLTHGSRGFARPSFSEDGKTVYMLEPFPGLTRLYRLSLTANAPQLLWAGCFAVESPKQNLLLYAKSDQRGIYARSLSGDLLKNPEVQLVEDYVPPYGSFDPVDDGIYYVGYSTSGLPRAFRFYSFATKQSVDIAPTPANYYEGLTVTPDRSHLAYTAETKGNYDLVQLVLN